MMLVVAITTRDADHGQDVVDAGHLDEGGYREDVDTMKRMTRRRRRRIIGSLMRRTWMLKKRLMRRKRRRRREDDEEAEEACVRA
eukprot:4962233-Pyramimonas_sp.AAC.1